MSIMMLACPLAMGCVPGGAWLAARLGRTPAGRAVRARCASAIARPRARETAGLPAAASDAARIGEV